MSNRETGVVTVEVQDKTYRLVLDVNAICELEAAFSTPDKEIVLNDILTKVARGSVAHIRALVWAALRRHHPEMTLAQSGQFIQDAGGLVGFSEKLQSIADSTRPDAEDEVANRPQGAQRRKRGTAGVTRMPPRAVSA